MRGAASPTPKTPPGERALATSPPPQSTFVCAHKAQMNHLVSLPACKPRICVLVVWSLPGSAGSMLDDTKINILLSRLSNPTLFRKQQE